MTLCTTPTPDLTGRLTGVMRQYRRDGARLAAMILLAQPDRIEEPIVDFLRRIEYVQNMQVARWMSRAGVHALTPGTEISVNQRRLLAGQLYEYSRGEL